MLMKKAIEIAKPFVIKKKKNPSRPILQYSLVTPEYVIATDGYRLIRIRHDEPIQPYLYDYKQKQAIDEASEYPSTERLFPDTTLAPHFTIDVKEWLQIHELAHIAAKPLKDKVTILKDNTIQVNVQDVISFKHTLDQNTGIEVAYNCEYMIDTLKAYKKAKIHHVDVYFFGKTRPMYFVAEGVEALLMPLRVYE